MFARRSLEQPPEMPFLKETGVSRPVTSNLSRSVTTDMAGSTTVNRSDAHSTDGIVIIGKGTRILGDITQCSKLDIQGIVEGRISADSLVVRDGGSVKGEVHAIDAEINGNLEGQVDIKGHLDVRSTGRVEGDLAYGKLSVAMGGHIAGQIKSGEIPAGLSDNLYNAPIHENISYLHPASELH